MKKIIQIPLTILKYFFYLFLIFLLWESIGLIHNLAKYVIQITVK